MYSRPEGAAGTRYSDITFNDPNLVKRYLQRRRLRDSLCILDGLDDSFTGRVLDFGGGNGELTGIIARRFPEARVFCYEPSPYIFEEARENLAGLENVVLVSELEKIKGGGGFEYVFCLEVFEHLPSQQIKDALTTINHLLKDGGIFFVGVPNELFMPALVKGLFRMTRRYGAFDARFGNVFRAVIGRPPQRRPVKEIASGLPYHFHHLGFDHRRLRALFSGTFGLVRQFGSPTGINLLDSEIYFVLKKTVEIPRPPARG